MVVAWQVHGFLVVNHHRGFWQQLLKEGSLDRMKFIVFKYSVFIHRVIVQCRTSSFKSRK